MVVRRHDEGACDGQQGCCHRERVKEVALCGGRGRYRRILRGCHHKSMLVREVPSWVLGLQLV